MKEYNKPMIEVETLFATAEIAASFIISNGEDYIFDDEGDE